MKIDIWSDFVCPYCYVGMKKFEELLNEFYPANELEINYRSFQLEPFMKTSTRDVVGVLANNYMISRKKAEEMIEQAVDFANSEGLVYNYKNMISANTLNAHRLIYYAKEFNKDKSMSDRLFKAHFVDGYDINEPDTLGNLGKEIGLDKDNILAMLSSDKYLEEVHNDKQDAIKLKIEVVPTFIFNEKTRISGVLSIENFTKALEDAKES